MEPHYAGNLAYVLSGNNERISTARVHGGRGLKEGGRMEALEIALFLRALLAEYRERNGGKGPEQIYASADVLASLAADKDALKKTRDGYSFDGVAIEPKPRQSLPFVLKP